MNESNGRERKSLSKKQVDEWKIIIFNQTAVLLRWSQLMINIDSKNRAVHVTIAEHKIGPSFYYYFIVKCDILLDFTVPPLLGFVYLTTVR